jgi:hypothetical protein
MIILCIGRDHNIVPDYELKLIIKLERMKYKVRTIFVDGYNKFNGLKKYCI